VTTLLDFTISYRGGASYFTGSAGSTIVPDVFPIAINGRPYLIDTKSGEFSRQFDERVRNSTDQSNEPGESSINSQGLWRRSQSSWHYGAGQAYSDTADAEAYRFNTSKGVNVWNANRLSLLKDTTQILATADTSLMSLVAGTRLYIAYNGNVTYRESLSSSPVDCTGEPGGAINSMTTNGYTVWASFAGSGVHYTNTNTGAFNSYISGTDTFTKIKYTKGRLMGAAGNTIYNWINSGAPGSGLFTHPNTNFNWVGFAGGQNHIYAAGYSGQTSLIYKTTIKSDATTLEAPSVAAELPEGEIVTALDSYLGYVLIGTTTGFRFASADGDGNLVVGPLVTIGRIDDFTSQGQFVWFSYKNIDSTSTGLGRMDISRQVFTNQPAWASDLMVTGQGAIPFISMYGTRPVFTVTGKGVYAEHATNYVASGTLDTGSFRWGVLDPKFVPLWDLHTESLNGSVALSIAPDGGAFVPIGSTTTQNTTASTFTGLEPYVVDVQARLTLTPTGDLSVSPVVNRWMGRAYAAPFRSEIFSVPVLLYKRLNVRGRDYFLDVEEELARLRYLVSNPSVVSYQENTTKYSVIVENIQWRPNDSPQTLGEWDWDGTCVIIMRSVR
jgi:hypothetical protein